MQRFQQVFGTKLFSVIGMIHLRALPGTPKYDGNFNAIVEQARHEANIYKKYNVDAVLVENMHDIPYVQNEHIGPEVIASMTRVSGEIKQLLPNTPCGLQVLASANCQALAIAKAANLQFIRAEGFVFAHVADEGFTNACAGHLLRYRKQIDAEHILIFTDLKKKHSSHAITNDVSLLETVHAAEFFLTDGIILTGTTTGCAVNEGDLHAIHNKCKSPVIIGSGVTSENINEYFPKSNAAIIGSYFKRDGHWANELCDTRIANLMEKVNQLRTES
ncbi:uncharacterized protein F13E9.13, mitochondrial [Sitodiplosis mosellana]|uniref:uncharacterized protein F13E9.13, mitochondrial n=1 Tax=Sitodiplosis mosellana TaxID=263140 RepID=UPI002444DA85|nr:uncharacterized protein F13E9.13, mitochondrial [Sitodiplosis mosellana]XP_055298806.1 uncharacterized protein F13E9.13, mitochondrial [Sitodiplosis mosellana]